MKMLDDYTDIATELQLTEPVDTSPLLLPYNDADLFDEQFNQTYASLQRNIRLKSRIQAITDAYFLGRLLNEIIDRTVRQRYCQRLTIHYQRMAENAFDLFEYCPEQIQRTQRTDVQRIRKIPRRIVSSLRELVLISSTRDLI